MLELFSELDEWSRLEHSLRWHDEESVLHAVQVAHDEQQVVALLHRQETGPRKKSAEIELLRSSCTLFKKSLAIAWEQELLLSLLKKQRHTAAFHSVSCRVSGN